MLDQPQRHIIDFSDDFWNDKQVVIDSRHLMDYERSLFFALPGIQTDGHRFVNALFKKGVRHFVVKHTFITDIDEKYLFRTDDVRSVLQEMAAYHRLSFGYPVIGLTGSNGKTTMKEWLFELLHTDFSVIKSPKSYNSQIG